MAGGGKTGAWSSKTNDKSQWIQIDFGEVKRVTQVASQGRSDYAQWLTKYRVSYSTFGKDFNFQDQVSPGLMSAIIQCNALMFVMEVLIYITESRVFMFHHL